MKKLYFSGLISCGLLLAAAQTNGQTFGQNGDPIMVSSPDHSGLFAYAENNIIILRWTAGNERNIDRFVIEHSTDSIHFTALHDVVSKGAVDGDNQYEDADTYPTSAVNFSPSRPSFRASRSANTCPGSPRAPISSRS